MSNYAGLADLVEQIKQASANVTVADARNAKRLDLIEESVNELYLRQNRPGGAVDDDATFERKSATEMCLMRYADHLPKQDGTTKEYVPSSSEIE
jgi:hypothetical protein